MLTHRQQSFIATLKEPGDSVHFLGALLGKPARVKRGALGGGIFTGAIQHRDDSHFLGFVEGQAAKADTPLTLYFRHHDEGFRLYVRSPGPYHGRGIARADDNTIGAFIIGERNPGLFQIDHFTGVPLTVDHLHADIVPVVLRADNGNHLHLQRLHDSPHTYVAATGGEPMPFHLHVHETNAAYLNEPDEV